MSRDYYPLRHSLWADTAVDAPPTDTLNEHLQADVVIVGGGYCGLSSALHLAERGVDVVLLEAEELGFGGSGRNGGQVIPGLKFDPSELRVRFGEKRGQAMIDFAAGTADSVFGLIEKHQMQVPTVRQGWIQGAHNAQALQLAEQRANDWATLGVPTRLLDRQQVAELIGSEKYLGGWLDPRGGGVQPLSYTRELGRAALQAGARIFTRSRVSALQRGGRGWQVKVGDAGLIDCERVLLCTNGYSDDLWPDLRKTVIDANSFQVATAPLPQSVRHSILPQGHVSSDARNLLLYYRIDHSGRLLLGGRGTFQEPDPSRIDHWSHLEGAVHKLFPQTVGIPFEYRWCGHVAVTRDYLPHLHEPAPGILIDIGCQGRGVGLQTRMGQALADYLVSGESSALPVPLSGIRPFPLYGLRRLYVSAVIGWYRLTDGAV